MPTKAKSTPESLGRNNPKFIAPMECLAVTRLPEGRNWIYEVKLDGFRAVGVRSSEGRTNVYSRAGNLFNKKFPLIAAALTTLPKGTVVDGEIVALDVDGRQNFRMLSHRQNFAPTIQFYLFDLLWLNNRDVTGMPLLERRNLLSSIIVETGPIRMVEFFRTSPAKMLNAVQQAGFEGVVAKRLDSIYEPAKRSGVWVKLRINQRQDFVIGGFIPGPNGIDSLILGEVREDELIYVGRVRAGFVPSLRRQVFEKLKPKITEICPFTNLPERGRSRWGESLNAEKMKECVWVKPEITALIEFMERTEGDRMRHASFVRLSR